MDVSKQLLEVAQESHELFLQGFYAEKSISYKGTVDLVTQYDVAIENQLISKLHEVFPEHTIIGEEHTKELSYPNKAIYIDPIDGTTNFVHQIEHCAISIGMWEDGVPTAAVVYNPVLKEYFTADVGKGAYLNNKPIKVSKQHLLQQSLVATGFPYTKVEKGRDYDWVLKSLANLMPLTRDIRRFGAASLDLCYLAQGKFDAYYECNLKPWDVAAGILIVQEAGGSITNKDGGKYNLRDHTIVASNSKIHDKLLEQL